MKKCMLFLALLMIFTVSCSVEQETERAQESYFPKDEPKTQPTEIITDDNSHVLLEFCDDFSEQNREELQEMGVSLLVKRDIMAYIGSVPTDLLGEVSDKKYVCDLKMVSVESKMDYHLKLKLEQESTEPLLAAVFFYDDVSLEDQEKALRLGGSHDFKERVSDHEVRITALPSSLKALANADAVSIIWTDFRPLETMVE